MQDIQKMSVISVYNFDLKSGNKAKKQSETRAPTTHKKKKKSSKSCSNNIKKYTRCFSKHGPNCSCEKYASQRKTKGLIRKTNNNFLISKFTKSEKWQEQGRHSLLQRFEKTLTLDKVLGLGFLSARLCTGGPATCPPRPS